MLLQCAIRLLTGTYPSPGTPTVGDIDMANSMGDYIARVATPVAWTTCASGIANYQCDGDVANQTCDAGTVASV